MITQIFIREFEMSLLRSYGLAARKVSQLKADTSVVGNVTAQDVFIKQFLESFGQKRVLLEREIAIGGHRETAKLFDKIQRMAEAKVQVLLFHKNGKIDEPSFQKIVRELKTEIRSVFYESRT